MKDQLEVTRANRKILEKMLTTFSVEELNTIPEGFSNNIIWNIAHVMVTQQLLTYKLSNVPMLVSQEMVDQYKKGTKADGTVTKEEIQKIKGLLCSLIDQTEQDIDAGLFKKYQEYPTSTGFVLRSVVDAISFNNFHEGIHLGYIMAMKKSL